MYLNKYTNLYNYFVKLFPKIINYQNFNSFNQFFIKQVEISFILPSELINRNKFIIILILIEKIYNNKVIFLLDTRTLSKYIKIGCILHISNENLMNYFNINNLNTIPKFYNNNIILQINNNIVSYNLKKIISHLIFNLDKDINIYYDYLGDFNYFFYFIFRSKLNSLLHNKLLLNILGFYNLSNLSTINNDIIITSKNNFLLSEIEENEEDIEEDDLLIEDDMIIYNTPIKANNEEIIENNESIINYLDVNYIEMYNI